MRFLEQSEGGDRREDGNTGQHDKNQTPGAEGQDGATKRRSDQRRDAEHDRNRRQLQAGLSALEEVADDRSRQDANRSSARSLHQAKCEQYVNRGRERGSRGAEREKSEA